jgi:hypothetical protein
MYVIDASVHVADARYPVFGYSSSLSPERRIANPR